MKSITKKQLKEIIRPLVRQALEEIHYPPRAIDVNKLKNVDGFWGWSIQKASDVAGVHPINPPFKVIADVIMWTNIVAQEWERTHGQMKEEVLSEGADTTGAPSGDELEKAQINKMRADMSSMTQKQRQISQSRKNAPDPVTKKNLSKQSADIGQKKADLGLTAAEKTQTMKDRPKPGSKPKVQSRLKEVVGQILVGNVNKWLRKNVPFPTRLAVKNGKYVIGTDIKNDLAQYAPAIEKEFGYKTKVYGQKNYITVEK